jgi:outer membrane biosynthesis protein TonB
MRTGLIMSVIFHVVVLAAIFIPHRRQTAHGETMVVDIVKPSEVPGLEQELPKQESNLIGPETQPASAPPAPAPSPQPPAPNAQQKPQPAQPQQRLAMQAQPQAPTQPQQRQQAPTPQQQAKTPPEPQQTPSERLAPEVREMPPDPARLAAMLHIPFGTDSEGFGSEAESKAKLSGVDIAAFKSHLKSCWKLPAGANDGQKIKVIVRVALRQNGTLATQPTLIEAAVNPLGPALVQSAMRALKQCEPYAMLPPEKYQEWRVLDLNFSPDEMAGS